MAKKFNSLADYIESFETTELKIRALVNVMNASVTENLGTDEFNEVLNSVMFPTDNIEGEPVHINKEESIKRMDMLFKIQGEYHKNAIEERAQWERFVEDNFKDNGYSDEQKSIMCDFYHNMTSKANNMHSTIMSLYFNLYDTPGFIKLSSQIEDGEELFDGITFEKKNPLNAFALRQEKHIMAMGNTYTRAFMNQDTTKNKEPINVPELSELYKNGKNTLTATKAKLVSQWSQIESAASQNLPWKDEHEARDYKLAVYGKAGIWTDNLGEVTNKMKQISTIYKDMVSNMGSRFGDSDEYTKMMASLKAVSDKYDQLNGRDIASDEKKKCKDMLSLAMKNAIKYAGSHITSRITPNGKARFNASMLVVGVCNMDTAAAVKDITDEVRGVDSPQKVNFEKTASKYKIELDKPFAYESMRAKDKVKNGVAISRGSDWEVISIEDIEVTKKVRKLSNIGRKQATNKDLVKCI